MISGFFHKDAIFKRLILNSSWLLSSNTIVMVLTTIQGIVVARALGVKQFGILSLITTFTLTVSQFVDFRAWETAIKFIQKYLEEGDYRRAGAVIKSCYLIDAAMGVMVFILLFLSADLAAKLFIKDSNAAELIRLYAFTMIIRIPSSTSSALLRIDNRFGWLAFQNVVVSTLRLAYAFMILSIGFGIKELLIGYLLIAGIGMSILTYMSTIAIKSQNLDNWWKSSLSSLQGNYGQMINFLFFTNGNALFKLLQRNADILLIGYWYTPTQVGYFRLARSIADLISFPTKPFYTAAYPEFVRLWHQKKIKELKKLVYKLTISQTSVVVFVLVFLLIGASMIIRLAVGEAYLPSLPVFYLLAFGVAIGGCTNFGHPLMLAIGQASKSFIAIGLGAIVQLAILIIFLPGMGITAAGIAYIGFYLIWSLIMIISVRTIWQKY